MKGFRRWLKQRIWQILPYLSVSRRERLVRSWFPTPSSLPADLIFKRAETFSEIEQAFQLIHDSYVETGLAQEHPSSLRITKYHALPTTSILIVKKGDEVIATLSVILDSGMGLPVEQLWSISDLRQESVRIAEISSLAIKRGHRKQGGKLLLPLCAYMYSFCRTVLGVDTLVAVTHPRAGYFYSDVLLFSPLAGGQVKSYSQVRDNPAIGQFLSIGTAPEKYRETYGHLPEAFNLHKFFVREPFANFQFPAAEPVPLASRTYSPLVVEYFFKNQIDLLADLSPRERTVIANVYHLENYRSVLGLPTVQSDVPGRQHARFEILCNGRMSRRSRNAISRATVLEVSRAGMKVRLHDSLIPLELGDVVHVTVELAPHKHVLLRTQTTWLHDQLLRAGLKIVGEPPSEWLKFIDQLESGLDKNAA